MKKVEGLELAVENVLESVEWEEVIGRGDRVLVKPNFLGHPRVGLTTDLGLLNEIIKKLGERGEVIVGETHSTGKNFDSVIQKLDLECPVVNLSHEEKVPVEGEYGSYRLPQVALESKVVNVPILKTHVLTRVTLGIKNLLGLLPEKEKEAYHHRIDHTLYDLYSIIRPELNLLDAIYAMEGQGPSRGEVREPGFIACSRDALALDLAACSLIGVEGKNIGHLRLAQENFPLSPERRGDRIKVEGFNVPEVSPWTRLGALLQGFSLTRGLLKKSLVRRGARKLTRLADEL